MSWLFDDPSGLLPTQDVLWVYDNVFYELCKERTEGNEGLKPGRLFCEKVCCRASSCHRLANYLVQSIILRLSRQLLSMWARLLAWNSYLGEQKMTSSSHLQICSRTEWMVLAQSWSLFGRGITGFMMFSFNCWNSSHWVVFLIFFFLIQVCCDFRVENGIIHGIWKLMVLQL